MNKGRPHIGIFLSTFYSENQLLDDNAKSLDPSPINIIGVCCINKEKELDPGDVCSCFRQSKTKEDIACSKLSLSDKSDRTTPTTQDLMDRRREETMHANAYESV